MRITLTSTFCSLLIIIRREGTNGLLLGAKCMRHFEVESLPYGINRQGRKGANGPVLRKTWGIFGGNLRYIAPIAKEEKEKMPVAFSRASNSLGILEGIRCHMAPIAEEKKVPNALSYTTKLWNILKESRCHIMAPIAEGEKVPMALPWVQDFFLSW